MNVTPAPDHQRFLPDSKALVVNEAKHETEPESAPTDHIGAELVRAVPGSTQVRERRQLRPQVEAEFKIRGPGPVRTRSRLR